MFLIDKYNIDKIDNVILHKDIYSKLLIGYNVDNKKYDLNELKTIIDNKNYSDLRKFHLSKLKIYKVQQE